MKNGKKNDAHSSDCGVENNNNFLSHHRSSVLRVQVAGVIQLSGLHSGWRTLCRKKQTSAPFGCCCLNPFNNANLVKSVRAPVLLVHGTEDEVSVIVLFVI